MLSRNVPLIGREAELSHITSALAATPWSAVVIAGRAGVGKSRLAAEVAKLALLARQPVAHVVARQGGASIPFGAVASLLPDRAPLTEAPAELIHAFCQAIAGRAEGGHPLLLIVDDAQFLDSGSAALLHQLVLSRSCRLVVTSRTPDATPEPIVSLWKEGLAQRIDIHDLARHPTDALVASYFGGPVASSARRWIWDVSSGNPLFVRELLIGAEETDSAYSQQGIWFLRLPFSAPSRLQDLIAARLSTADAKTAEVVDLLAIGEPLGLAELAKIAGPGAVEEAEERGLISVVDDGGQAVVRLSHPLYREKVQQRMPRLRLRRLSATLADAIRATGALRRGDVMRVARWRLDAGCTDEPDLFVMAAREARLARDVPMAARFARAAVDAGGGVAAALFLGETEFGAGRHQEAEEVFARATPACHTDEERSAIASARSYNLGSLMGDERAANEVIESALAAIVDTSSRHRLQVGQAVNDVYSGRLSAALARTDELLGTHDEYTLRRIGYVRTIALGLMGRTDDAVATGERAFERSRLTMPDGGDGTPTLEYQRPEGLLVALIMAHVIGGRLAQAESNAHSLEAALDLSDPEYRATSCLLYGWILTERGQVAEAVKAFRESAALSRAVRDIPTLRWSLGAVAMAEAMSGHAAAAGIALAELSGCPDHWLRVLDPHTVDRGRGWALIASGQRTSATAHLLEAAQRARAMEHLAGEAILLHDLVRLGEAKAVGPRLTELTELVDGDFVTRFAAHAEAQLSGDPMALETVAVEFEKLGAMMLAAETMQGAAVARQAQGESRKAGALSRESTRLYGLCGGVRSPVSIEVNSAVLLSRRELEIALLAAPGASSKAIAAQLHLSARTVDNHLLRIYAKLGLSNRDELAGALRDAGLERP